MMTTTVTTIQSQRLILTDEEKQLMHSVRGKQDYLDALNQWRIGLVEAKKQLKEGYRDSVVEYYSTTPIPMGEWYVICLRAFAEIVKENIPDSEAKVLDIAAGTGLLGTQLRQQGFINIDALEPAQGMVDNIPPNTYDRVYVEGLYHDKPTSIPTDTYDCATIAGSVGPGHIEEIHMPEIVRIIKPGGIIMFNVRDTSIKREEFGVRLDAMLQTMLEDATLLNVSKQRSVFSYDIEDANVYTLKVT